MGFLNEEYIAITAKNSRMCSWCGRAILKGTPHYVLINAENNVEYPVHERCHREADKKCNGDMETFLNMIYE